MVWSSGCERPARSCARGVRASPSVRRSLGTRRRGAGARRPGHDEVRGAPSRRGRPRIPWRCAWSSRAPSRWRSPPWWRSRGPCRRRSRWHRSLLAPAGYWYSYRRRRSPNLLLKIALSVALLAALGQFLGDVRGRDLGRPGAHPARVAVPVGAGAARVRRAATARPRVLDGLEPDPHRGGRLALAVDVVRWCSCCRGRASRGAWLSLSSRPRADQVTAPEAVRRIARRSAPRRARPRSARPRPPRASRSSRPRSSSSRCRGCPGASCAPRRSRSRATRRRSRPSTAASRTRACPRSRATAWSTSPPAATRGSATWSTCGRVGSCPTTSRSACERSRPRSGGPRCSTATTRAGGRSPTTRPSPCRGDDDGLSVRRARRRRAAQRRPSAGGSSRLVQTFYIEAAQPNVLFAAASARQVYFPSAGLRVDAAGSIRSPILLDEGLVYSVVSEVPVTDARLLRGARRDCLRDRQPTWRRTCSCPPRCRRASASSRRASRAGGRRALRPGDRRAVVAAGEHRVRPGRAARPRGRRRGRPLPVRDAARVLRADRHVDGGDAAHPRHPDAPRHRIRSRRAQPAHRLLRGEAVRRARVARGLLPGHRMGALRPHVRRAGSRARRREPVHGGAGASRRSAAHRSPARCPSR